MATKYKKAKIPGIRYKEHDSRKVGIQKDKYYYMFYQLNGKQKEEGVGWLSQGWTEKKVAEQLFEIKNNIKLGKHPQSLKEKREMAEKARDEEEAVKKREQAKIITLQQVFDKYIVVHQAQTSGKTWKVTQGYYNTWIKDSLGSKNLNDITIDHIEPIINKALKIRAPRTAEYIKVVLRQIFNFAISRDLYFKKNPALKVIIPAYDNKRTFFFSNEQAQELIKRLYERREIVGDMVNLAFHTGCRASEIFNLEWKNVDLDNRFLILLNTKRKKTTRYMPIDDVSFKILSKRAEIDNQGIVFKNTKGEAFQEMPHCYKEILEKMGLRKKGMSTKELPVFHSTRHTFGSNLVINDVNLREVQTLMGHATSRMTERYSHLAPDHLKKAISKLNYRN